MEWWVMGECEIHPGYASGECSRCKLAAINDAVVQAIASPALVADLVAARDAGLAREAELRAKLEAAEQRAVEARSDWSAENDLAIELGGRWRIAEEERDRLGNELRDARKRIALYGIGTSTEDSYDFLRGQYAERRTVLDWLKPRGRQSQEVAREIETGKHLGLRFRICRSDPSRLEPETYDDLDLAMRALATGLRWTTMCLDDDNPYLAPGTALWAYETTEARDAALAHWGGVQPCSLEPGPRILVITDPKPCPVCGQPVDDIYAHRAGSACSVLSDAIQAHATAKKEQEKPMSPYTLDLWRDEVRAGHTLAGFEAWVALQHEDAKWSVGQARWLATKGPQRGEMGVQVRDVNPTSRDVLRERFHAVSIDGVPCKRGAVVSLDDVNRAAAHAEIDERLDLISARLRAEETAAAVADFRPGLHRHTKSGGLYNALFLAFDHERRDPVVVYVSMTHGSVNVRPLFREGEDSWADVVAPGEAPAHMPVERFVRLPDKDQPR